MLTRATQSASDRSHSLLSLEITPLACRVAGAALEAVAVGTTVEVKGDLAGEAMSVAEAALVAAPAA